MTSRLMNQWLDACIIVPSEDCTIIAQLAERAAAEGHAVYDLAALQKYALTTDMDEAEASLVQSLKIKSRAIDAAAAAAAEEDAARAAKVAADAKLVAAGAKARVAKTKAARATKAAAARRAAAAKEEATRRIAEKEAEARRIAAEAAAAEETESDDEDEWAEFWAGTEAQLRGDVTETAEGYDVVLRGADELDVSVEEDNSLRVSGVIIPSPPVQDKILAMAKRRAMRYGHGRVTEEDVIAASKGRFGRVDELVRLPANADVGRATLSARGRDVVVRVPRRAPPRRRVRRAVDPYYGRALFREPSYPPIYSY